MSTKSSDPKLVNAPKKPDKTPKVIPAQPETKPAAEQLPALNDALPSSAQLLALQRSAGNRATARLIQTKLTVGAAGDRYEQEADRVAQQVMTMPAPASTQAAIQRQAEEEEEIQAKPLVASITPLVQRAPEEEEELQAKPIVQRVPEEEEELQAKPDIQRAAGAGFAVSGDFEQDLAATRGGGSPLSDGVRDFMEPRFGADFSGVRIHTGSESAQLNRAVSAQAFTLGQDIYLGAGKEDVESAQGKSLLAHELTHVVQQTGARQVQRSVTFKRDEATTGPDITIGDYTPTGQEKTAVDECTGYITAGTAVEQQTWAKNRIAANSGKVPGAIKKFKWGELHANRDGDLPGKQGAGGYKEYYVRRGDGTDGGEHPQRRIVIRDSDGKKFYTNTHYGRDGAPAFYELKS